MTLGPSLQNLFFFMLSEDLWVVEAEGEHLLLELQVRPEESQAVAEKMPE